MLIWQYAENQIGVKILVKDLKAMKDPTTKAKLAVTRKQLTKTLVRLEALLATKLRRQRRRRGRRASLYPTNVAVFVNLQALLFDPQANCHSL